MFKHHKNKINCENDNDRISTTESTLSNKDSLITVVTDSKTGEKRKYSSQVQKTTPRTLYKVKNTTKTQLALPEEISFEWKHFFTCAGFLKILQLIAAVACMVFFSPPLTWFTRILCAVTAINFAITTYICIQYMFTLYRVVMPKWPWIKIEIFYSYLAAFCYLVASILHLVLCNDPSYKVSLEYHFYYKNYIIAGAIGLVLFVLYALGGQFLLSKLKRRVARQPKVYIVRTTLDKHGKPIKQKSFVKQYYK